MLVLRKINLKIKFLLTVIISCSLYLNVTLVNAAPDDFILTSSNYETLVGDYDGDTLDDIYLRPIAVNTDITIPYDYTVNVPITAPTGHLVLKQESNGSYTLITTPDLQQLASVSFNLLSTFKFYNGDIDGDNVTDTLIRSTDVTYNSFLLQSGTTPKAVSLTQQITTNEFGLNFTEGTIQVNDNNGDGRDDIEITPLVGDAVTLFGTSAGQLTSGFDPNSDFTPPQDPNALSSGVGTIPGVFSVSASGKPNYSVSLRMPPSVANIAPSLAFVYTGQSSDSMMGVGWYLDGLSEITRCPTNLDRDNYVDGVNFNDSDKFCLNGQRLVLISGTYGQPSAEYRTENESFVRVIANASSFTVWRATGEIETYGGTADSRQQESTGTNTFAWKISRKEDREGNYVEYQYFSDLAQSEHYIEQIRYSGNSAAGLTPQTTVDFLYEARTDITPSHANSHISAFRKRLNRVEFTLKGSKIREYILAYQNGVATGRSQLTSIQDCAVSSGTQYCLPATTFEWGTFSNIVTFSFDGENVDNTSYPTGATFFKQKYHLVDVNADGRSDVIWTYRNVNALGHVLYLAKDDGSGFELTASDEDDGFFAANADDTEQDFFTGDFNGDGRTDLLYVARHINDVYRVIYLANNTGTAFVDQGYLVDTDNEYQNLDLAQFRTGDVNGDGRTDLVWIFGSGDKIGRTVYLAEEDAGGQVFLGRTSMQIDQGVYSPSTYNNHEFLLGDVNGDGKADLVWTFTFFRFLYRNLYLADDNGGSFYRVSVERDDDLFASDDQLENAQFSLGDVNGDGKADLVWTWKIFNDLARATYISSEAGNNFNRTSFDQDSLSLTSIASHTNEQTQLADVNADGRADLIYTYNDNTNFGWVTLIADTDGTAFTLADSDEIPGATDPVFENHQYHLGDVTLDGRPDMVWLFNNSLNDLFQRVYSLPQAYPDHIDKITDGFDVETQIQYAYLSDPAENIYLRDNTATYPLREDAGESFVVKNIKQSNGIGGLNNFNYTYMGARTHLRGRGFVGFQERTVENVQSGFIRTDNYVQRFPLIGRLESSVTVNPATGQPVTKNFNHWKTDNVNWGGGTTEFPYLHDTVTINYEIDGGEMSTTLILNNFDTSTGNLSSKTRVIGYDFTGAIDGAFDPDGSYAIGNVSTAQLTTTTTNDFISDLGANWRPGFLIRETQTFNSENDASNRTVVNEYDPLSATSYLHAEERQFVGSDVWITNHYSRDTFGNVTQIDITAADVDGGSIGPFNETMGPYDDGLYPQQSANHLNHTASYVYDERIAAQQELADVNGLKSFQFYDDFGRAIIGRSPSGAITESDYELCDASCPALAKFKVTTSQTHSIESVNGSPTTTVFYDQLNREIQRDVIGFAGQLIRTNSAYDNRGRMVSATEPYYVGDTAPTNTFQYDDYDRVTNELEADGGSVQNIYSTDNTYPNHRNRYRRITTVNKTGNNAFSRDLSTDQWTNAVIQIRRVEDAEGIVTELEYDAQGNTSLTRVDENTATEILIETNVAGSKTRIIDPDIGDLRFEYDGRLAARRQSHVSATETHQITSVYDAIGRLSSRTDDDGTTSSTANWTYDTASNGVGLLATMVGTDFSEQYTYDLFSRALTRSTTLAGLTNPLTYTYNYDGYDRIRYKLYPSGFAVRNDYNANGYLTETYDANNNALLWQGQTQDARQNYTQFDLGNGLTTNRQYDQRNGYLLSAKTGTSLEPEAIQNLNFEFDSVGNVYFRSSQRSSVPGENLQETFQYDDIHRLSNSNVTGLSSGTRNVTFAYNNLGNILTKSDASDANGYIYAQNNAGIHAVTQVTNGAETLNYGYDFKGNMTSRDDQTLEFSVFNKATRIASPSFETEFKYDPNRSRFYQKHTDGTGNIRETWYVNGREYELVREDNLVREKSYVGNTLVHSRVRLLDDSAFSEDIRYLHHDHIGSTESITNSSGQLTARLAYDTHGQRLDASWERPDQTFKDALAQLTFETTTNGFTGHESLADSGLIHMNGRIYDPYIGRFISPDVFVQFPNNSQSYNRYTYVHNNPTSYTDPSGNLLPLLVWGAVAAYKAYNVYDTVSTSVDNYNTVTDPDASLGEKALAVADSASALAGVPKPLRSIAGKIRSKAKNKNKNTTAENSKVSDKQEQPDADSNSPDNKTDKNSESKESVEEAQVVKNKREGTRREEKVAEQLQKDNPNASVQREQLLRDCDGCKVKDPVTGTGRRVDDVVIEDGKVIDSVEVTSQTANKSAQIAKENRIREAGGTFIRDRETKELVDLSEVPTRIIRED